MLIFQGTWRLLYFIYLHTTFTSMIKIDYPLKKPAIKNEDGKEYILCGVRKRWVVLSPEEWVRQNFILYLTGILHYPLSLMAVEKKITIGQMQKRFDIVLYATATEPFMLVECKEMNVALGPAVLEQAMRYNIGIQAPYLVISNGLYMAAFKNEAGQFTELKSLPVFE
ncbi:MAG: type I restriction enzyme HsdR N-terminal domain-containing protein [Niastella sp.]|nr:type I restriction enzyme HsdR N-terminal domain-containing protein [Niastella sp.]